MDIEIIAHRGASRERHENTLPAFARALELGADGIELDVHATRDGVIVVHHDATLPDAPATPIAGTTLGALRVIAPDPDDPAHVATLEEVFRLVANRATVYVEIKAPGITAGVARCIRDSAARAAIHAFDHRVALEIRAIDLELPTGILSSSYVLDPAGALRAAGARDYWQHASLIDQPLVDAIHDAGGRVVAWTVNAPEAARALAELGVDALCSDVPEMVRLAVERAIA